jgi:hypothetical protein
MADKQDITLKISVLDAQGQFRGGSVDVDFEHRTLSDHTQQRGLDASREIDVGGLRRAPTGDYKVTVTTTDVFKQKSQFVNIPASGFATMKVTIDRAHIPDPQPDPAFVVKGIVHNATGTPFTNGLVRAIHQNASGQVLLGEGRTDAQGNYSIKYSSELVTGSINLRAQAFDVDGKMLAQSAPIAPAKREEVVNLTLPPPEPPVAPHRVQGHVRGLDGSPLAGLSVRAFDRDLPSLNRNELLGEAVTGKDGFYGIEYTAAKFSRAEKETADLQVRVYPLNMSAARTPLAESETRFNATPEETIDLVVTVKQYQGPSEYERLLSAVAPLVEGVPIANLTAEDIDFLSGETGLDGKHLTLLSQAHRLAKGTDIAATLFYGWFRQGLPADWEQLRLRRVSTLRKALLDAIAQNIIPAILPGDIESMLAHVPNPQTGELTNLLGLVALSPDRIQSVLAHTDGIEAISDEVLTQLVERNILAAREAQSVGLGISLHRLVGGDQTLVSTMLNSAFASLSTGRLEHARDLASLEPEDWETALGRAGSPLPAGAPRAEYARTLAMDAVNEFPHAAFVQRATRLAERIPERLNTIQPLLENNANAVALDFDALDLTNVRESDREGLREAHAGLQRFANLHPGLNLHTAFSTRGGNGKTAKLVNERVGWLRTVFDLNPAVDFLNLDYLPESVDLRGVKFGGLSEEARGLVLQDLRAHQRIYTVSNNAISAREIMQAGFHSASAIARTRVQDFAGSTGLAVTEARAYYDRAREVGNEAAANWFRLFESARDRATTPIRSIPSHNEFFRPPAGFNDLINSQPWCECAHCQSVLSPAAYFVDLMYYIEENILKDSFRGNAGHPLHLRMRRPDLWELELTCKNTNDYVPYLDLVNEILERYLKDVAPPVNARGLYQYLAEQEGSFKQPFTLPIERLEILLEHFGLSRYDIAKAMGTNEQVQACARLKLSKKEYDLITIARTDVLDLAFFKQLFKIKDAISISSSDTSFNPIEMQTFLHATGLAHEIVASVFKTKFVNDDGSSNALIEVALGRRTPEDVQNNSELVSHLTLKRLDRIHRFVRLWRKLPWTVEELDYVLARLKTQALAKGIPANGIDADALDKILDLLDLNAKWSLPVDELMAISDVFPETGLREPTSLFDRLFNQTPFLNNRNGPWPPDPPIRFTHPAWASRPRGGASSPDNNTLSRLLAGLQLVDKELVALIASLSDIPAFNHRPATLAPPSDESIELSKVSISILYRHARLMRLLKCAAADFIKLIRLTPSIAERPPAARYIRDLEDVTSLMEFAAWQKSSGFSLDALIYLTGGPRPREFPDPAILVSEIVASVRAEKSLEFADTVFTQIGLTDIQSRKVVLDNSGPTKAFELISNGASYRLNAGFILDPAPRLFDASTGLPADKLDEYNALAASLLRKYDALHVLDVALGGALKLSPEQTKEVRQLARPLSTAEVIEINRSLRGEDSARLTALLTDTLRYRALFKSEVFLLKNRVSSVNGLSFVQGNRATFGLPADAADQTITVQVVRNVAAYVALATVTNAGFTTASEPADIEAIQAVISGVATASEDQLAKALRTDKTRIAALKPHLIHLPDNPFEALGVLARCLVFTEQMGVSGETLSLMTREGDDAFVALSRAAEDVFGAFRAKYPDEKIFNEKMEPFEDQLRTRKRDGLVDFVVSKWPEPFADPDKLYEYFLIDVLLAGCARTSRVVAAISSLQLYVQRVLMNLEWSNGQVQGASSLRASFTDPGKQAEWYWRKHYRVWEANRKVFLYPENYIEPELRDDKTPLFKELEDTLLQQEISDSNVLDAYAKYLTGFDEAARLKIAGAYYDQGSSSDHQDDALHLFGVTQAAPPVYYYRVVRETLTSVPHISNWQKLTLQIPVRKVSPIMFEGRLYVFWMETTTRALNNFASGTSTFEGYRHAVRIKYSMLRADGAWIPPQSLSFSDGSVTEDSRIVNDPRFQSEPNLQQQTDEATQRVGELTRRRNDAVNEERRTATVMNQAFERLGMPASSEDVGMDALVAVMAEVPAGIAFASAMLIGGPLAAEAAAAGMRYLILAGKLGVTVQALQTAGVTVVDAPHIAERRLTLWTARVAWEPARDNLRIATEALNRAQADLDRLRLRRNVITVRWDKSGRSHAEPLDNYRPEGWEWDRVYPNVYSPVDASEAKSLRLMLVPRDEPVPSAGTFQLLTSDEVDLVAGVLRRLPSTEQSNLEEETRVNNFHGQLQLLNTSSTTYAGQEFYVASFWLNYISQTGNHVALAPPNSDLQVVNGTPASVMIDSQGYAVWMRKGGASPLLGTRLGTTLTLELVNRFGHENVSGLLNAEFQRALVEHPPSITPVDSQNDPKTRNPFDRTNPFLSYFRETFFHIPFLVANHLNSRQKFVETQRWYHHIFNPTAADGNPWRYREFNGPVIIQSLREMLTDPRALAAYRAEPFNPHAIARTRLRAYQKSIVMKYIDNLLDWGDSLFSQFTTESLNEATMLYVMAQEILGPKPPVLGSCGEGKVSPKSYRTIRPGLNAVSDFLIELEAPRPSPVVSLPLLEIAKLVAKKTRKPIKQTSAVAPGSQAVVSVLVPVVTAGVGPSIAQPEVVASEFDQAGGNYWTNVSGTQLKDVHATHSGADNNNSTILGTDAGSINIAGNKTGNIDAGDSISGFAGAEVGVPGGDKIKPFDQIPTLDVKHDNRDILRPGFAVKERINPTLTHPQPVDLVPPKNMVFCIPPNKDLLAYWGRVEDRLFKIRNCMDIAGVRRLPELFEAEIDPRLLVRMEAAGLTLDDVLNSISGNVPPYRFSYLIEKAKQYAGTLQSFGAQLLSAFEKRDGEALADLRAVHEHNLLTMRTRMTKLEIDAAEDTIEGLRRQKVAVEYRHDYFRSLSDVGLVASERTQQQHQRQASEYRTLASVSQFIAAVLSIIPDVGAPTAMKFGGSQLGAAGRTVAEGLNAIAGFNEMAASMAGMESSNRRREQDWKHQEETAKRDILQLEKQITAAEIRRDIALHSLEVHQKTIDQAEEVFEFFRNEKFTNINLYRLLSTRLQGLYRQAFNSVLSMARMTEQAFSAERTDDDTRLSGNYWDAGSAGLLAGERLLIDLESLERRYIEKNYRQLEIEQSFSLAQFAPGLLAELRLTGECEFSIPEWFFDLFYPGQYRRRLKAVRLTIPCVTGPFTNVGATLRLESSSIRLRPSESPTEPTRPIAPPTPVPLRHTVSIAASKAQYDSGVFDFNFRDERYMPFEGAGAISHWRLALPETIRVFDYATISDVILHLSYTAEFDGALKTRLEDDARGLLELLERDPATGKWPLTRSFSFRQDFPDVFHRLVTSPPETEINFKIEQRHFPFFLMGRTLKSGDVNLRVLSRQPDLRGATLAIGEKAATASQEFRALTASLPPTPPVAPNSDGRMRQFDFVDAVDAPEGHSPHQPYSGIATALVGEHVIKLAAAGLLAPDTPANGGGAIDPKKLHDIILEVGYGLVLVPEGARGRSM